MGLMKRIHTERSFKKLSNHKSKLPDYLLILCGFSSREIHDIKQERKMRRKLLDLYFGKDKIFYDDEEENDYQDFIRFKMCIDK